jgi:hypothetical protein
LRRWATFWFIGGLVVAIADWIVLIALGFVTPAPSGWEMFSVFMAGFVALGYGIWFRDLHSAAAELLESLSANAGGD